MAKKKDIPENIDDLFAHIDAEQGAADEKTEPETPASEPAAPETQEQTSSADETEKAEISDETAGSGDEPEACDDEQAKAAFPRFFLTKPRPKKTASSFWRATPPGPIWSTPFRSSRAELCPISLTA